MGIIFEGSQYLKAIDVYSAVLYSLEKARFIKCVIVFAFVPYIETNLEFVFEKR